MQLDVDRSPPAMNFRLTFTRLHWPWSMWPLTSNSMCKPIKWGLISHIFYMATLTFDPSANFDPCDLWPWPMWHWPLQHLTSNEPCKHSDRENYFWHAGQNVRQAGIALPDILSPCQTIFTVDDWQISMVILVFHVGYCLCIEPCWTKCPARSQLSAGHQQKSAGHVRHVRHISRSLPW